MQICKKSEIIDEDMFDEVGEDISVISVVSQKLAEYVVSKSDTIEEIDEDDVDFKIAIDGDEITIVFYCNDGCCESYDYFMESLRYALENNGMDCCDMDEMFGDFENEIDLSTDIKSINWFYRSCLDRHNLDCVIDSYFEEAKTDYMYKNDISEELADTIDDDAVEEYVLSSNCAYVTKTYVFNKNTGEDGISSSSIEIF